MSARSRSDCEITFRVQPTSPTSGCVLSNILSWSRVLINSQDRLADALPSLTLDTLAVKIKIESMKDMHWFTFSSPSGSDSDSARRAEQARIDRPMPPPCETELYISTLAADALARRFLQASQSLKSVEVDVAFWWNSEYENKNVRMTRRELYLSAGLTGASDLSAVTA